MLRFLLDSFKKDVRLKLTDPFALALWIGIPVAITGLMGMATGGGSAQPSARVLVVDEDQTFLTGFLARAGTVGPFELEAVEREPGLERMDDGEASALVALPSGLSMSLLDGSAATLEFVTNPAQTILPGMVREALGMLTELIFYAHEIFGPTLKDLASGPPGGPEDFFSDQRVAEISAEINREMRSLSTVLFPPVLQLADPPAPETPTEERPGFGDLFLPGSLLMALLFIAQGTSDELWKEARQGTLRRAVTLPHSLGVFLGGKLLATSALMVAVALVGLSIGSAIATYDLARIPLAALWGTYGGAVFLCHFLYLQTLARSQRAGSVVTTAVLFPILMLGGSFFPFEAMPDSMAELGRWLPNGLIVVHLRSLLAGSTDWPALFTAAVLLGLPALGTGALTMRRLRGRFLTGSTT